MSRIKRLHFLGMDTFARGIIQGVHHYCESHGNWEYHVDNNSPEAVARATMTIRHWKARDIGILASLNDGPIERLMRTPGVSGVNFSGSRKFDLPTVTIDNVAVGRMAAQHFLDNGFRNFAFCAATIELYVQERYEGYRARITEAGFPCALFSDQFVGKDEALVMNRRRMDRWLKSLKTPVAMMCMYDQRGHGVALACRRLGLRVPTDVAIVSVGNDESLCLISSPALSSVDLDLQRIGYEAARLVDQLIEGGQAPAQRLVVPPRWVVVRQSSDIVMIDDPDISAAMHFIRHHSHEPIGVKDLLREVPISRKTMERGFKKFIGRMPKEEIMRLRMDTAQRLLDETDLSIEAVAEKSGFPDQKLFSVSFRRKIGMTPTAYRRKCRLVKDFRRYQKL
jgi:LacI family transcriptional regulator